MYFSLTKPQLLIQNAQDHKICPIQSYCQASIVVFPPEIYFSVFVLL